MVLSYLAKAVHGLNSNLYQNNRDEMLDIFLIRKVLDLGRSVNIEPDFRHYLLPDGASVIEIGSHGQSAGRILCVKVLSSDEMPALVYKLSAGFPGEIIIELTGQNSRIKVAFVTPKSRTSLIWSQLNDVQKDVWVTIWAANVVGRALIS